MSCSSALKLYILCSIKLEMCSVHYAICMQICLNSSLRIADNSEWWSLNSLINQSINQKDRFIKGRFIRVYF